MPESAPSGAYVEPDGSWYERDGYALPATAGQTESDGTKAKDYATMSDSQQNQQAQASYPTVPQGLVRAINNGWGGYHRVTPPTQPLPPEEKY